MDLKPISFSGKTCFNVCSDEYKKSILEHLFTQYQIVITNRNWRSYDDKYKNYILKQNYLLSVKTIGNPYYLLLTKDSDNNNICLFIDKKIVKGYNYPRMIYIIYRFDDDMFNDTLFDGELLRNDTNWCYIINNISLYKTKNMVYDNFKNKLELISKILTDYFVQDTIISPCEIKLKKYFKYSEIDSFKKYLSQLDHDIYGYFISPLNQKHPTLYIQENTTRFKNNSNSNEGSKDNKNNSSRQEGNIQFKNKSENKHKSIQEPKYLKKNTEQKETTGNGEYISYFKIGKTNRPGIYQLFCEKNGKIIKHSIARVENLELSNTLRENIEENGEYTTRCKYNKDFEKWVPIELYNHCNRIDNYNDILELIK